MLKLASSIGLAFALSELKQRIRRLVTQGVLGAIGGVILLIGLVFLLVAAHLGLSLYVPPFASAAIIGGVLILVALIFFLVARSKGGASAPSRPSPPPPVAETAQDKMAELGLSFGSGGATPALLVAGLALILGFVFGRRSGGSADD